MEDIPPRNITFFFRNCKGLLFPRASLYFNYIENVISTNPTHSSVSEDMLIFVPEMCVVVFMSPPLMGTFCLPPKGGFHFLTPMSHSSRLDCYKQVGKYLP